MPSGTLLRENRGRRMAFHMSTGRDVVGTMEKESRAAVLLSVYRSMFLSMLSCNLLLCGGRAEVIAHNSYFILRNEIGR